MRENTEERWGSVQIGLHWTIAALVLLVQVPAGVTMVAVDPKTTPAPGTSAEIKALSDKIEDL